MAIILPLNDGWEFAEQWVEGFEKGKGAARRVELPHTVKETPFHCFDEQIWQMLCGYRRTVSLRGEWKDKRVSVLFGAAAHRAEVFVNGEPAGTHECGYTAFEIDLTPFAKKEKDLLIAVRLDSRETLDQPPFGLVIDYMTYGGLYREASLIVREKSWIRDVFAMPHAENGKTALTSEVETTLEGAQRNCLVRQTLRSLDGAAIACGEAAAKEKTRICFDCPGVRLWDVDEPNLYELKTELIADGEILDAHAVRIGFRHAVFQKDGFYLNGRKLKILGLNRHQSYPYVGYAMPASQQRLDADVLKNELGVNAVRTSHYPQSHHFIDRCDELGLLVFTEIPGWQHIGGAEWKDRAVKNVEEMVRQYRNHPSIVLWGVRINESRDDDEFYARTNACAHALDPTRQTSGVRCIKKSSLLEDVYAYNDFIHSGENAGCEKKKKVTSDIEKGYFISEFAGHMYPTKTFDDEEHRLFHALRHANVHEAAMGEEEIAGCFGWCMFDYNTHKDFGSGDRICYHGVTDMFRNSKLAAAVYSSNLKNTPVLEVSSSMEIGDHPASFRGRLFVFTNADSVRVYKNGEFIKEYAKGDSPFKNLTHPPIEIDDLIGEQMKKEGFPEKKEKLVREVLNEYARLGGKNLPFGLKMKALWAMVRWKMRFEDAYALYGKYLGNWGDRQAVYRFEGYKDGKLVKTVEKTPMTAYRLEALPDRTLILRGGSYEVVSVRLRVKDDHGNLLPYFFSGLDVQTEGALERIGNDACPIRGGTGGLYFRTNGTGEARVKLTLDGCEPLTLDFEVKEDAGCV